VRTPSPYTERLKHGGGGGGKIKKKRRERE